jgi:hypothetical protein
MIPYLSSGRLIAVTGEAPAPGHASNGSVIPMGQLDIAAGFMKVLLGAPMHQMVNAARALRPRTGRRRMSEPLAYKISELPFGKTKAFELIASGELRAVKLSSRTLILRDELQRFLATLPIATGATMKTTNGAIHAKHGDAA